MFQPTHPHGVRRPLFATDGFGKCVSTHAPARGATGRHCPSCYHAGRFNPRTRTGCDQYVAELAIVITCFNPRTRTGCDSTSLLQYVAQRRFQPTHPHGVRRSGVRIQSLRREFQPTHPHGVRLFSQIPESTPDRVSTHAPARGATSTRTCLKSCSVCFNPRTRTGCDLLSFGKSPTVSSFNPRTRTGCDLRNRGTPLRCLGFNPRTRTGCDELALVRTSPIPSFNPRTRTGCDLA